MSDYTCPICDTTDPAFAWTDTHGIAQCFICGAPTRLLHYDDDGKRLELPYECVVDDAWTPLIQAYWQEHGRRIPSGCSIFASHELATPEEQRAFSEWADKVDPKAAKGESNEQ